MPNCAIYGCSNTNRKTAGTSIKYYSFPRNEDLLKYWIQACRRKDKINLKYAKICSIHFSPNCFQISLKHQLLNYTPRSYRNLKDDAIPTEYLPSKMNKSKLGNRTMRINKRNELKDRKQILDDILNDPSATDPDDLPPVNIVVEAEVLEIDKYQGILVNVQPDAFDVPTEQRQTVKSKDISSKRGTFFSEFGDELKCRTCMQSTSDGLPLDAPCFTTSSIKDAIIQLLPELVPYLEHEDVVCPNCVNKFNTILKFLENCLRVNNSLACLADKDLDSLGEQNNEKPLVLEDDDSFDDMFEAGGKSMVIEKQNEVDANKGIKPGPKRCFIYSTFLTIPNNDNVVSFNGIESDKSLELARTFTDLGIRVVDESKGNGKKRIVLIGNNNIWMCPICRMTFRLESELHKHAVEVHNLLKAHLLTPKTYFNKNSGNSEKCKVFNCPYCDESVPMNSLVEHTVEKHGDPKPFKCFNCRKVFGSYKWYKRHSNVLYRHPLYKTVCKICDKRMKWESYKEHFDSHKTFQCEFCDKCFTNKTSLRTHVTTHKAIHKGESTLCPFCGKTFSIQGLNIHVKRVHEEQTKGDLLCHICSKTLCTKKALARHMDSVHNAKQVDCKLCGKIFRSNISLQYHLRCNVCNIKFGYPFCKREFIRKNRLKLHMIKNHNSSIISESKIIRRRIRSDDVGEAKNTENINDLDANVGMNMEIES